MQHNIKKITCMLAILLPGSCCPADAKSIEIRGTPGSVESGSTMLLDRFNFPELFYHIGDDLSSLGGPLPCDEWKNNDAMHLYNRVVSNHLYFLVGAQKK
ncbi:MAG: hypothetical protein KAR85_06990 [Methanosarcinales archaeon]|nr:hypothetical protein [Methanosarcinales archaeon]